MTRYNVSSAILALSCLLVFTNLDSITAFTMSPASAQSSNVVSVRTTTFLSAEGDDECTQADDGEEEEEKGQFNWLEEWALEGKDAVALMKTAERTQRVMLAQMTEDRIFEITKVLDTLVDETTGQIAEADIPKAKELAIQTRNLQKEYKDLVTGAPSTMLETLANLNLSDGDEKKEEK